MEQHSPTPIARDLVLGIDAGARPSWQLPDFETAFPRNQVPLRTPCPANPSKVVSCERATGFQWGVVNYSPSAKGLRSVWSNTADNPKGLQMGLVNVAKMACYPCS